MSDSNFNKAFEKVVLGFEGGFKGWVKDPDDPGGETYAGLSKRANPGWPGWPIIESAKACPTFPKNLNHVAGLKDLVKLRFREHYWDEFDGDNLPSSIATKMFNIAVHTRPYKAVKYLQIALNKLNRKERYYNNIVEDGIIGKQTHGALSAFMKTDGNVYRILVLLTVLQGSLYIKLMDNDETFEKYVGWLDRLLLDLDME